MNVNDAPEDMAKTDRLVQIDKHLVKPRSRVPKTFLILRQRLAKVEILSVAS
jgi:hypothetical protein